ncbi:hypothetical protein ATANTOWER_005226, partial [Ataeniobius toweri]|nr:hypothetical protein [Ataeniobius toweri]
MSPDEEGHIPACSKPNPDLVLFSRILLSMRFSFCGFVTEKIISASVRRVQRERERRADTAQVNARAQTSAGGRTNTQNKEGGEEEGGGKHRALFLLFILLPLLCSGHIPEDRRKLLGTADPGRKAAEQARGSQLEMEKEKEKAAAQKPMQQNLQRQRVRQKAGRQRHDGLGAD